MPELILSVSDCIALVNQTLEYAYPGIVVEGEVASFKINKEKFIFFDLKDESGVLGCFMMAYQLRLPLENGMKVRVRARPRLTAWGKFSLTVSDIRPQGEGAIKRSFELLKAKLEKEGLFEQSRKRLLPTVPERVGLIGSVESAGYADFLKILHQRWGGVELVIADVQVQGAMAAAQIERALYYFNSHADPVEVIVMVRGGGSAEDLAVFNEEPLVRAVAASRIPTLVGVGHETDISLVDLAADVRAATPSNAAQLLVPDRVALASELSQKERRLVQKLDHHTQLLNNVVAATASQLLSRVQHALLIKQQKLKYMQSSLNQLNPKAVLKRGYGLVRTLDDHVAKEAMIKVGDQLHVELVNSIVTVGVTHVRRKK